MLIIMIKKIGEGQENKKINGRGKKETKKHLTQEKSRSNWKICGWYRRKKMHKANK